jgi:hypothetical protein
MREAELASQIEPSSILVPGYEDPLWPAQAVWVQLFNNMYVSGVVSM